jgi:hypothetical protein
MVLGAAVFTIPIYVIVGLYFTKNLAILWSTNMLGNAINGYGSGMYWIAQGTYMSHTIADKNKSYYMGIFYGM